MFRVLRLEVSRNSASSLLTLIRQNTSNRGPFVPTNCKSLVNPLLSNRSITGERQQQIPRKVSVFYFVRVSSDLVFVILCVDIIRRGLMNREV
jgi:hypothetical protein